MSEEDNHNFFLKFLKDVKPLRKKNIITKSIPKLTKVNKLKIVNTEKENDENIVEKKKIITHKMKKIQKSEINKKLKRNKIQINRKIDLHGHSVEDAKNIFFRTIDDCFFKNQRCILFITGKGSVNKASNHHNETKLYYGKIRNSFINWTSQNYVQSRILSVQQADKRNGGDGAFFVYLRKNKN